MEYDIIFAENGNGKVRKQRFPDGESVVQVLNYPLEGKKILYVTENKMREPTHNNGCMDWIFITTCLVKQDAEVDLEFNFHKNSDYFRKFLRKLAEVTGANIIEDSGRNSKRKGFVCMDIRYS